MTVNDGSAHGLGVTFDFHDFHIPDHVVSVRNYIFTAVSRFESDRFEFRPGQKRVEGAFIHEEFAGPSALRIRGAANGYVNASPAPRPSPLGLVSSVPCA